MLLIIKKIYVNIKKTIIQYITKKYKFNLKITNIKENPLYYFYYCNSLSNLLLGLLILDFMNLKISHDFENFILIILFGRSFSNLIGSYNFGINKILIINTNNRGQKLLFYIDLYINILVVFLIGYQNTGIRLIINLILAVGWYISSLFS